MAFGLTPRTFLLVAVLAVILFAASVFALPVSPVGVNVISTSTRELPATSDGSVLAQGGNVTEVNIDALTITKAWQGYYGNISGNIHLDDANNNSFYVWGNATSLSGEIFASRNSTIQWITVSCANSTLRDQEDSYLGLSASDGDSVINTFNATSHPSFYIGSERIAANSCYSTNVFVNGSAQNASFYQMFLADNASNVVYSTLIEHKTAAYNGQLSDFQLMVGENDHVGSIGPTTYYFFVEIS